MDFSSGNRSSNDDSSCPLEQKIVINEYEKNIVCGNQAESNKEECQSDNQSPQKIKNGKIPCRWINCKEVFNDEDGLYDHLIAVN